VLTRAEAGKQVSVEVMARKAGYQSTSRTSDATLPVLDFTGGAAPSITGTARVGQTLTASVGTWPGNGTFAYQWKSGGTAVGTNTDTYVPATSDVGKAITVTVTWSEAGYPPVPRTSGATAAVVAAGTPRLQPGTVTIDKVSPKVGQTVIASASGWPPDTSVAFQWQRDGGTIATGVAYTVTADDKGKALTVIATGTKDGYQPATASVSTSAVAGADFTSVPTPTISGAAKIGSTLTATVGTWAPAPDTLAIQWLRGGVAIPGATGATYKVAQADAGLKLSVQVTAAKGGYNTAIRASAPTAAVPYLGKTTAATPKISGTAKVGKTLKAKPGTWKPKGFSFTYQWFRSGAAISGAIKASYKPTIADKGKKLTVKVTGKKAGYPTITKASKATGKVK
jgi:hypothetical protein